MMNFKNIMAASLALALVGSLAACSRTSTERTSYVERERPVATETQDYSETPVARNTQTSNETTNENTMTTKGASDLKNLQPGQPTSYYTDQFKKMGYNVVNTSTRNDRMVYDLKKGDRTTQVTLMKPAGQDKVSSIQSREMNAMASGGKQGSDDISQRIKNLEPGKKAVDYLSELDDWGTVTDYRLSGQKATVKFQGDNKKNYNLTMNLKNDRETVTSIQMK